MCLLASSKGLPLLGHLHDGQFCVYKYCLKGHGGVELNASNLGSSGKLTAGGETKSSQAPRHYEKSVSDNHIRSHNDNAAQNVGDGGDDGNNDDGDSSHSSIQKSDFKQKTPLLPSQKRPESPSSSSSSSLPSSIPFSSSDVQHSREEPNQISSHSDQEFHLTRDIALAFRNRLSHDNGTSDVSSSGQGNDDGGNDDEDNGLDGGESDGIDSKESNQDVKSSPDVNLSPVKVIDGQQERESGVGENQSCVLKVCHASLLPHL